MEEECVLNHKKSSFLRYLLHEIIKKQAKESSYIFIIVLFGSVPFDSARLYRAFFNT